MLIQETLLELPMPLVTHFLDLFLLAFVKRTPSYESQFLQDRHWPTTLSSVVLHVRGPSWRLESLKAMLPDFGMRL